MVPLILLWAGAQSIARWGPGQPSPLLPAPACKLSKQCKLSPAGLGAGSAHAFSPQERW